MSTAEAGSGTEAVSKWHSVNVRGVPKQVFQAAIAEADRFLATGDAPTGFDLALQLPEDTGAAGQVGISSIRHMHSVLSSARIASQRKGRSNVGGCCTEPRVTRVPASWSGGLLCTAKKSRADVQANA